jgi:hypothetical protein
MTDKLARSAEAAEKNDIILNTVVEVLAGRSQTQAIEVLHASQLTLSETTDDENDDEGTPFLMRLHLTARAYGALNDRTRSRLEAWIQTAFNEVLTATDGDKYVRNVQIVPALSMKPDWRANTERIIAELKIAPATDDDIPF